MTDNKPIDTWVAQFYDPRSPPELRRQAQLVCEAYVQSEANVADAVRMSNVLSLSHTPLYCHSTAAKHKYKYTRRIGQ